MAHRVELEFAAKTDTGLVRSHNEDAIAISPDCGFAILADGMGGYSAGEIASGIAIASLKQTLELGVRIPRAGRGGQVQRLVVESILSANAAIFEAARAEPQYRGMGTTVVVALFHHQNVMVAHVGDSRAYRFRQGVLEQITRDHSLLQEQIDAGLISPENARFAQNRNLVTRALGVDRDVEVEGHDHQVEAGDLYLLCSDGLSDMLSDQEIAGILGSPLPDLQARCDALVLRANEQGGKDNISVVLVQAVTAMAGGEGDSVFDRMLNWIR
ncbi:MAG: Stp1/IreP family PP2C-type Ser/Thr phosphatase [Herminiimonas sp.]|nr:Stp1/IreP family PP2C-type Ser/Thr phosphatase [Herminiimonas sp.]